MVQFELNDRIHAQSWFNVRDFGAKSVFVGKWSEMYAKKRRGVPA
jgi:hypothetical protein